MPRRPPGRCPRGCGRLASAPGRPCAPCTRQAARPADAQAKARAPWRWVYGTARWAQLRDEVLSQEPLCRCGCGRPSVVVDHVVDHRGDVELAFDRSNLQGMAKRCHDRKTALQHSPWVTERER